MKTTTAVGIVVVILLVLGGAYWYWTQGGEESMESEQTQMTEHPVGSAANDEGLGDQSSATSAGGQMQGGMEASTTINVQGSN